MSDIKNVNLGFNCPKTKDSLNRTTKDSFHCSNCSKEVIDTCGIFNQSQLSRTFLKYAAATALIGSSFLATAQGQHVIEADSVEEAYELIGDIVFGEVVDDTTSYNYYYPEPIGGMAKFYEALMTQLKYPDSLKTDGRTFVKITVDTTGNITTVEVIKGFDEYADKESVRAIESLNYPFKTADNNGKPVESHLILPINFKRDKD
jgi:hypothetical protein